MEELISFLNVLFKFLNKKLYLAACRELYDLVSVNCKGKRKTSLNI